MTSPTSEPCPTRHYGGSQHGFVTISELSPTNSYMAQPIMCSATTTGPETEKILPLFSVSSEAIIEEACVEWGDTGRVEVVEEGESGSGGSSAGGDGNVNVCFEISSNKDGRAFNRGRPKPSIRFVWQNEVESDHVQNSP